MLGSVLGISTTDGGYVVGGILVVSFLVVGLILESKLEGSNPAPFLGILAAGLILSNLFGWWPIWATFFALVLIVFAGLGFLKRD